MLLFNTLSGKKEVLDSAQTAARAAAGNRSKQIRLFVCGPTVYDEPHLGHARTYIVFDAFVKYLRSKKIRVQYLQNITDIDDKIIARAKEAHNSAKDVAETYTDAYKKAMRALGIDAVDIYAPATKFIKQIAAQASVLFEKGYAYRIEGDGIYFDVTKFPEYGRLSRRTALQAEDAVSRIDESLDKRNKGDFALWKFSKENEPSWKSPLGAGRPGWHIEDTAISAYYFGPQYEMHGGAIDLKFPHHEAEIAQAEAASGEKPFVRIWMHTGFLTVNGEKMSKSLKNFIAIGDFLKKYSPQALRLMTLMYHYRSPVNYTATLAENSEKSWRGIVEFFLKLEFVRRHREPVKRPEHMDISRYTAAFEKALEDDFNTPKGLAALFDLMRAVQPKIWNLSQKSADIIHGALKSTLASLGFSVKIPKIPRKISVLAKDREKARRNKQFAHSDALRKEIERLGYVVEDTPAGPFVWPKS